MKKSLILAIIFASLSTFNQVQAISEGYISSSNGISANELPVFNTSGNNTNIKITNPANNSIGIANWQSFNAGNIASGNRELPVFSSGSNVIVTTSGNNMNIKIANPTQNAVGTANWQSFNIGKNAGVNVQFTAPNQTSLNYVNAAGGMSKIYGSFTNSGYSDTGKVLLINPNGVLFGKGANVDLNSLTVSTLNGSFDKEKNTLTLDKTGTTSNGIKVENGAVVKGDKNVSFVSDNINLYKGSQIKTGYESYQGINTDNKLSSVKLVTSDGITFKYDEKGNVASESNLSSSLNKMNIKINGNIDANNIDIKNASKNSNSHVNLQGANLKAHKFVLGNDGSIYITSDNDINIDNSNIGIDSSFVSCNSSGSCYSVNFNVANDDWTGILNENIPSNTNYPVSERNLIQKYPYDVTDTKTQAIKISAKNNLKLNSSRLSSSYNSNDIKLNSEKGKVTVTNSSINTQSKLDIASKQNLDFNSNKVTAGNVKLTSTNNAANIRNNSILAKGNNIDVTSKQKLTIENNNLKSRNGINLISSKNNSEINGNDIYTNEFTASSRVNSDFNNNEVASNNTRLIAETGNFDVNNNNIYTKNDLSATSKQNLDFNNNNVLSNNVNLISTKNSADINNNNIYTFNDLKANSKQIMDFNNNDVKSKNIELTSTKNSAFVNNNNISVKDKLNVNAKSGKIMYNNNISYENGGKDTAQKTSLKDYLKSFYLYY